VCVVAGVGVGVGVGVSIFMCMWVWVWVWVYVSLYRGLCVDGALHVRWEGIALCKECVCVPVCGYRSSLLYIVVLIQTYLI